MTGEFYDRHRELAFFSDKLKSLKAGELIIFYGRRRLGKTSLIRKFLDTNKVDAKSLYLYINIQGEQELKQFMARDIFEQWKETIAIAAWKDFFSYLKASSEGRKTVVVIDEFQRLKTISPSFITELQNQWDSGLKNASLMLILVGSSIGMMKRIAISPHGALYGRKTAQIQLAPFRYIDFREMFPGKSEEEKIAWHSVFGGTPYYLELAKKHKHLEEAIIEEVLTKQAPLREEPKNLLEFELKVIARYNSLLYAIGKGKRSLKEICDVVGIQRTTLPPYLNGLQELLALVERRQPMFGKKNLGRYELKDNFFKFWYSFILPHSSSLEIENIKAPLKDIRENLPSHIGMCVEDVIRELFILYNGEEIKGVKLDFEKMGAWWDRKGNEIDLVIDGKNELLLGEVKWTNKQMGVEVLDALLKKSELVNKGGKRRFILVSKNGFEPSCKKKAEELGCLTLDIKDMRQLFDAKTENG
ncbi:MAG: ATP-binding protein [Candidatus Micrarchaeota archaeon]